MSYDDVLSYATDYDTMLPCSFSIDDGVYLIHVVAYDDY